ncbi:hypothetical protein MKEN_01329900 [Mycena kentingensis (nom. inval.)]|nr:hypothetical protein MKEN_01329900 [Mycena kentingensis (nom. inval.)]
MTLAVIPMSPDGNPNYLQGSAMAALVWVVYDAGLTFDREVRCIWKARWSVSKALFILSRYHTIVCLSFFLMEAIGTEHFTLPIQVGKNRPQRPQFLQPCVDNLPHHTRLCGIDRNPASSSRASRWYLGLTEVLSIMAGEFLILLRINAVYGWSRAIVLTTLFLFISESIIGLVTTIVSIIGGRPGLFRSSNILTCVFGQNNIPDVNFSMWCTSLIVVFLYIALIAYKSKDLIHATPSPGEDLDRASTRRRVRFRVLAVFNSTKMTPTLHVCLRDAAIYFVVISGVLVLNLVLILARNPYAQQGTAWLLATYSVASTRIFLNLKDLTEPGGRYNETTWSQFEKNSAVNAREIQAALNAPAPGPSRDPQPEPEHDEEADNRIVEEPRASKISVV